MNLTVLTGYPDPDRKQTEEAPLPQDPRTLRQRIVDSVGVFKKLAREGKKQIVEGPDE